MASAVASNSLTTATTGKGTTVDFVTAVSNVSMFLLVTDDVTGGRVRMQASHSGTTWTTVRTAYPMAGKNVVCINSGGAFRYWRAVIDSDITGGGTITATFMEAG